MPMNDPTRMVYGTPPADYNGPKRSLILSGGGMRVAYQAGAMRALFEAGLCFAHVDGTSGGSINLSMLFSGHTPEEMCERWKTLNVKDFVSFLPITEYLNTPHLLSLGDAEGIREKVLPHLGIDMEKIHASQGVQGTINICNYNRKTNEVIPHDRMDMDLLIAGISLPIFLPPVRKGDTLYMDSAWIKDANLMEAVRRGAEELWLVWCLGNSDSYHRGIFEQYVHMMELSANGALFEEFDRINEINSRIEKGEEVLGHTKPITLHLIKPSYPLPLDPDLFFGRIDTATLIDMGYADARQYLGAMQPGGLPFRPEVTKMHADTIGLSFQETMSGGFVLDESDPKQGSKKGNDSGSILEIHVTVTIRDLDGFVDDPDHVGDITGHIDFTPFGNDIPAGNGIFNLFSPSEDPQMKLMVYELGFTHGGTEYYLAGRKEVKDDPGFDLWSDTTTLFTRLHRGTDKTGEVVGAGVLSLGVNDLIKLLKTVTVINADSTVQKSQAILKFGGFFLGELWGSYARFIT